jgi:hypothetical protein
MTALPTRSIRWLVLPLALFSNAGCSDESGDPSGAGGVAALGGTAGASGGSAGAQQQPTGGSSAGGSLPGTGGTAGAAGADAVPDEPPPLGEGGVSPYSIQCENDSLACGHESLRCVGIRIDATTTGWACSNQCERGADCTESPEGTAPAACIQFTSAKRCMLSCQTRLDQHDCPSGMQCFVYPGTDFGYCLYM